MGKNGIGIIRSLINGEIAGSRKLLILILLIIVVFSVGFYYQASASRTAQTFALQQGRFITLNELAVQYKELSGNTTVARKTEAGNIVPVFSQIVEEAGLHDRLQQISPVARGVSIQMDRLYIEELIALLKGISKNGIRVVSSELRALPFQDKRLFSFFAMLEVI